MCEGVYKRQAGTQSHANAVRSKTSLTRRQHHSVVMKQPITASHKQDMRQTTRENEAQTARQGKRGCDSDRIGRRKASH